MSLAHYYMKSCLWSCNRTRKPATAIEGHQFDYDCDSIDSFPRSAILVLSQTQTEIASRKKSGFEEKSSTRLNSPEGSEKNDHPYCDDHSSLSSTTAASSHINLVFHRYFTPKLSGFKSLRIQSSYFFFRVPQNNDFFLV